MLWFKITKTIKSNSLAYQTLFIIYLSKLCYPSCMLWYFSHIAISPTYIVGFSLFYFPVLSLSGKIKKKSFLFSDDSILLNHILSSVQFSSLQLLSLVWLFATPWIAACQASLSITNPRSSVRFTSIESVMPSSHLILCRLLFLLPPIPPSIKVFSNESTWGGQSTGVSALASVLPKKTQK